MEKGEIARFEQFHLFLQCFPKAFFFNVFKIWRIGLNSLDVDDNISLQDKVYIRRLERLCDTVVHVDSFVGSDKEKNPAYKEYHGMSFLGISSPARVASMLDS